MFLKQPKKVNTHLGYFSKRICHQEISKIAQSGHAAVVVDNVISKEDKS